MGRGLMKKELWLMSKTEILVHSKDSKSHYKNLGLNFSDGVDGTQWMGMIRKIQFHASSQLFFIVLKKHCIT